ncbi:MAG TPA: VOC family protein [Actinomycetota bacterium]|nr:VOC family protein [Actinomycetota bacterium]
MASTVDALTFDCADPRRLAEFWAEVLGYRIAHDDENDADIVDPAGEGWPLLFQVVPEGKAVKNRMHLDLRPPVSMAAEVERVVALGATVYRYVEELGSFWTVMRDPEGNEFCVLRGPEDGWSPDE